VTQLAGPVLEPEVAKCSKLLYGRWSCHPKKFKRSLRDRPNVPEGQEGQRSLRDRAHRDRPKVPKG